MRKKNKQSDFIKISKSIALVLQLGLNMIVATAVGLAIGYWLDKWLSTKYFIIIFIFLGMGAGIRNDYLLLKRFFAADPDSDTKYKNGILGTALSDKEVIDKKDNEDGPDEV